MVFTKLCISFHESNIKGHIYIYKVTQDPLPLPLPLPPPPSPLSPPLLPLYNTTTKYLHQLSYSTRWCFFFVTHGSNCFHPQELLQENIEPHFNISRERWSGCLDSTQATCTAFSSLKLIISWGFLAPTSWTICAHTFSIREYTADTE